MGTLTEILGKEVPIAQPKSLIEFPSAPNDNPAARIARNMEIYHTNPWAMVEDGLIWTLDGTDLLNPVKQFPDQPWLKEITMRWMEERFIAVVKSRRMLISWLFCFLHTWLMMFREGASIYFVSQKEEKSDELVKRCTFIYDHIPESEMLKPASKATYCKLAIPGLSSFIMGIPEGARQLAQYTGTALFFDEFAHWDYARETFMAAKPTTEGGGKITLVSSPREGFYKELCFDMIR